MKSAIFGFLFLTVYPHIVHPVSFYTFSAKYKIGNTHIKVDHMRNHLCCVELKSWQAK